MAGRPKRTYLLDDQEVMYETVHWRLDTRIVAAVREINARGVSTGRKRKPALQETAEGVIYWGLRCAQYHKNQFEVPKAEPPSLSEAEDAGFSLVEEGTPRIGEIVDGKYKPDKDKLKPTQLVATRKRRKPRVPRPPVRRIL